MWSSWWRRWSSLRHWLPRTRRRQSGLWLAPRIEALEGRWAPATVTNLGDLVSGSLRDAILNTPAGGIVDFQSGLSGTINLDTSAGPLVINKNLTILGPGASAITVSGQSAIRVFEIQPGFSVTISGLTIQDGSTNLDGGGILNHGTLVLSGCVVKNNSSTNGAGLANMATSAPASVTIVNSTFEFNVATTFGGAIYNATSGPFAASMQIIGSALLNNSTGNNGGAIFNTQNLGLVNSTIAANSAGGLGGGIHSTGLLDLTNVTVTNNVASSSGGGINETGTAQLKNTIVAENTAGNFPDYAGTVDLALHNLIGNGAGSFGFLPGNGNLVGTASSPINPQLGPLQFNGGPTQSRYPLAGSPVINAGLNAAAVGANDQRGPGFNRVVNLVVDIGAVEFQPPLTNTVLSLSPNPSLVGQNVTFTAQVTGVVPGSNPVQGSVSFFVDSNLFAVAPLINGVAVANTAGLSVGVHQVQAIYNGDDPFNLYLPSGDMDDQTVLVHSIIAVGTDVDGPPIVRVFHAQTGALLRTFFAYNPRFRGGVRVAVADINGDGFQDIITGAGPGGGPHVQVFDGQTGGTLLSFYAYAPSFRGGVFVAGGYFGSTVGMGIVTGADAGGGPHVRLFNTALVELSSFFAYDPSFRGGVRVAAGDTNGDGTAEIITGAGPGGGPHVRVFDALNPAVVLASFYAYSPTFRGGIYVAAGDLTGNGRADIVTGAGVTGGSHVRSFDGLGNQLPIPAGSFFAYAALNFPFGIRVATALVRPNSNTLDIVTGPGPDVSPLVLAYNPATLFADLVFFAFDPLYLEGIFVGG
ncbi:MAG: Ig-like domain repeat protein [Gemmataceae bacterium]|nr:Ig-like domain repeat protein [Gemmataceae bacterium]MDW8267428.1 choice-of-anchor Q domain-containing protein [Gemmataceae bacterium]